MTCASRISRTTQIFSSVKASVKSLVHRYCVGVTVSHYREIETCSMPFVCVVCTQQTIKAIITQLQSEVALLKKELDELKMAAATSSISSTNRTNATVKIALAPAPTPLSPSKLGPKL